MPLFFLTPRSGWLLAKGWVLTFDSDDRAILRRRNRSFTVPVLERPLDNRVQSSVAIK